MRMLGNWILLAMLAACGSAVAQDKGTLAPLPLPPLSNPRDPALAAREIFGRQDKPTFQSSQSIGSYARGCLAGGAALPIDGTTWQVMRLSRNRNWGHPTLIAFLERLAGRVPELTGWAGLLVGDMAQPRGGPMITGHASHQIGLDADVWLTPMPQQRVSRLEREEMSATDMVRPDKLDIDPAVWTSQHATLIKAVAKEREVARVFVNAAIKRALCREAGSDRDWLNKVRPIFGHNYHFHIRLSCPAGESDCANQAPPPPGDGCGAELAQWFTPEMLNPRPGPPRPPMTMAQLPDACRRMVAP